MKIAVIIVRTLMGALFLFGSITFLFNTMEAPVLVGPMKTFMDGLNASIYMMPLVKIIELICGLAFISGRFVTLASVIISPIIVNIFLLHVFLGPENLPIGIFLVLANGFLAYSNRQNYAGLFKVS